MTVHPIAPSTQSRTRSNWLINYAYLLIPVVLCALLMAPRVVSAQFGLFDDGVTITNALASVKTGWNPAVDIGQARFRPVYWLSYELIYWLVGARPQVFFLANAFMWMATSAGLAWLVRRSGGSRFQAGTAGVLFALSGPVFENYYTLSKGEELQLFYAAMAMVCASLFTPMLPRGRQAWLAAGAIGLNLLALSSKETSLLLLPASAGWLALAWLWKRKKSATSIWPQAFYFGCVLAAAAIYLAWRTVYWHGWSPPGNGYATMYSLTFHNLAVSLLEWRSWMLRDFTYVAILGLFAAANMLVRRRLSAYTLPYAEALVWMAGWFLIFLPWIFKVEYYLLCLAAGCAFFAGLAVGEMLEALREKGWAWRGATLLLLVLAGSYWLAGLPDIYSNARYQLTIDSANAELLARVSQEAPQGSHIYVNLPASNEYSEEIRLQLATVYGRPDLNVSIFNFQRPDAQQPAIDGLVLSPYSANKPVLSTRFSFHSFDAAHYLEALEGFLGPNAQPTITVSRQYTWYSLHLLRLACPFFKQAGQCQAGAGLVSANRLQYGWYVYAYHLDTRRVARPGSFLEGAWRLAQADGSLRTLQFGQAGDIPLAGDWDGDGLTEIGVYRPANQTWYLDVNMDGRADVQLQWKNMLPGDLPLVGDWNGTGRAAPGFYRPSDGSWYVRGGFSAGDEERLAAKTGRPQDIPMAGDWNGDGKSTFGVYRPDRGEINLENQLGADLSQTDFTAPKAAQVVPAAWGGQGQSGALSSLAYVQGETWELQPANCACELSNPVMKIAFPVGKAIPVAGRWK